jgi:hypothetical protein
VAGLALRWGTRLLRRASALRLLAGGRELAAAPPAGRRWLAPGVAGAALAGGGLAVVALRGTPVAGFFLGGTLLLVGLLAIVAWGLGRPGRGGAVRATLGRLALRNLRRARRRSLLVVALLASAAFLIVTVAANRRDLTRLDTRDRGSGAGGFTLIARATVPLHVDPSTRDGRRALGISPRGQRVLERATLLACPVSEGEEISCLNQQQPEVPRVLGVPPALIARGGFAFGRLATKGDPPANPWELLAAGGEPIPAFADAASAQWILKRGLGEVIEVPGVRGEPVRLRLVGLLTGSIFAGEVLVAEEHLARLRGGAGFQVLLIEPPPGESAAVAETLRRELGDLGLDVQRTADVLAGFARVQNTYLMTFGVLGGLGLLLGTFGLLAVLIRGVLERRGELALLVALGWRRRQLVQLLLVEHGVLLVAGLLLGAGPALVAVLPQLRSAQADVPWAFLAALLAGCAVLGLAACALAALHQTRRSLLPALRSE